jgi:signal transduction histidine kinase
LNLNQIALTAAGIELWEWDVKNGFSWVQSNPANGHLKETPAGWRDEDFLQKLTGTLMDDAPMAESWRSRIRGRKTFADDESSGPIFESAGRILQRGLDGRPAKAIGLLQDISALQRAEEALIALGYQKAKLRSLQAKLTPHFLFNSLNVIHALVHIDPKSADEAITSLASLLRSNLRTYDNTLIALSEELDRIRELLHLAKLRFGDRILTRIRVPAKLMTTPVPPMLLLNLVENAITHGIGNLEDGGMITISARAIEEKIRISVRNTGTLPTHTVRGVGTQDALQRLEMLFGGRARFSLSQMDEKTVAAEVDLPLPTPLHP